MTRIEIANVVGGMDIGQELDLEAVQELLIESEQVTNTIYEPAENHWLQSWFTVSDKEKSWYVAFYRSGACTIAGCESFEVLEDVADSVIQSFNPILGERNPPVEVMNIVGVFNVDSSVNLSHAAVHLGLEKTEYEPEQFAGLIYHPDSVSGVVLIFASGEAIITGVSNKERLNQTVEEVHREFKMIENPT